MIYCAALVIVLIGLTAETTTAFRWGGSRQYLRTGAFVHSTQSSSLRAYRQAYQYQLDQMTDGSITLDGEEVEVENVAEQMDKDLEEANSQEAAANKQIGILEQQMATLQAEHDIEISKLKEGMKTNELNFAEATEAARSVESTVAHLQMELRLKEDEKRNVIEKLKEEMKHKEEELRAQKSDFGDEYTQLKIKAHKSKMAAIEEYKQRENDLHADVEKLQAQLAAERALAYKASASAREAQALMRQHEEEMKEQINEYGSDYTHLKLEIHQEQQALMDDFKFKEAELKRQISTIRTDLEAEKEKANVAKDLSNQITKKRVEIDGELEQMRRLYEEEKETHAFHNEANQEEINMLKAQIVDVEKLKSEIASLKAELNNGATNGVKKTTTGRQGGSVLFEPYKAKLVEHFGTDRITKDMIVVELRMWNQPVSGVKWEVAKRLCEFLDSDAAESEEHY